MKKTTQHTRFSLSYEATQILYGISIFLTIGIMAQITMHL